MRRGSTEPGAIPRKLGGASFPGIRDLHEGRRIDESQILELLEWIDRRLDCADFRLVTVLRTLYAYSELISAPTLEAMKRSVLTFRYAMDEPGEDSMCFWSENHQLLFASSEYLAGALYPGEIFANAGMTGAAHRKRGRARLLRWLSWRWDFGFSEWHSNTYYEEDAAGLALLVDFSPDADLRRKAEIVLDLLLVDIAAHSLDGFFAAASGRCYEEQKKDPSRADVLDIAKAIFDPEAGVVGEGGAAPADTAPGGSSFRGSPDCTRIGMNFLLSRTYAVPPIIREIGRSVGTVADSAPVLSSMGLDLSEIAREFPDAGDMEGRGMFLWGMEAFTNPQSVDLSMKMWGAWNLKNNGFLRELRALDKPFASALGLLPAAVRLLNPVTQGLAIQRGNTYTLRGPGWMLSTAQRHHAGEFSDQQHIWQATFASGASIFVTHPAKAPFLDAERNATPGYWTGNGILPDSVQDGAVHMSIYDLRRRRGFMERPRLMFTHAWVSPGRFDVIRLEGRRLFARTGASYVLLLGKNPLRPGEPGEFIQDGALTYWICEISSAGDWADSGGFEGFCASSLERNAEFSGRRLVYRGKRILDLTWKGPFLVDGKPVDTEYPRFDSPWGRIERKPAAVELSAEGHSLRLGFESGDRDYT